jgi:hypothetical protein
LFFENNFHEKALKDYQEAEKMNNKLIENEKNKYLDLINQRIGRLYNRWGKILHKIDSELWKKKRMVVK